MNFFGLPLSDIIAIEISFGILVAGIAYAWAQVKSAKAKQLTEVNEKLTSTLNELIATQDKKIGDLQAANQDSQKKIATLEGRVEELSKKNTDLQGIINQALDRYFQAHPEEAIRLAKQTVKKQP